MQRLPLRYRQPSMAMAYGAWGLVWWLSATFTQASPPDFQSEIAPVLERYCLACHNENLQHGGLSLATAADAARGGESGPALIAGDSAASLLVEMIDGSDPAMPKEGERLNPAEVELLRAWIQAGAAWPETRTLTAREIWWSRKPLIQPAVPELPSGLALQARSPIDSFIMDQQQRLGLSMSPEADRRTLIRRLTYDLTGLPPSYEEVQRFVMDPDPLAYERVVDRLLSSPAYGEHWARHWLDVVHYGDTHGFDKDKVRPNAWPYRDYVVRALNEDRPYEKFVREQLAGDHFFANSRDGIEALGFLAAGPFDYVGQIEVSDGTMEKQRVRNIDRDDMVNTTMTTFVSATANCARCHDHKFDPISQRDYYGLQAVFAAVDRADRQYDRDPRTTGRRIELQARQAEIRKELDEIEARSRTRAGAELEQIEQSIAALREAIERARPLEYGFHSALATDQNTVKWVQLDLGTTHPIERIVICPCDDDFNQIGAGFGFPVRFKIEASTDPEFLQHVSVVSDQTALDVPNPGNLPLEFPTFGLDARYVRITAEKLAPRLNDFNFAIAELMVFSRGVNVVTEASVQALDSIEAAPRWSARNLIDGKYPALAEAGLREELAQSQVQHQQCLASSTTEEERIAQVRSVSELAACEGELATLPSPAMVFAVATEFKGEGQFQPTHGRPRPIHVLKRGNEATPDLDAGLMEPGALSVFTSLGSHFEPVDDNSESQRRAALANWIVDRENPLTWRSIVNRVWHYHFGRGICATPDDFGRMGEVPTHPELLDWLAVWFRDQGQSLKQLHRLIVTSATYRQGSFHRADAADIDESNRHLWRMNRSRLTAEQLHDAVLLVAGRLDRKMGGPGYRAFGFLDDHSPHFDYRTLDIDSADLQRRAVYRFIVRSVPDPFMAALDCADPSINVARRNETLTPLQALSMLNNPFMMRMAEVFASELQILSDKVDVQIEAAYQMALGRRATDEERQELSRLAAEHGLVNACRLMFNLSEFMFID